MIYDLGYPHDSDYVVSFCSGTYHKSQSGCQQWIDRLHVQIFYYFFITNKYVMTLPYFNKLTVCLSVCQKKKKLSMTDFHKAVFCAAYSSVRLNIETKFLISNYRQPCQNRKYGNFVSISSLTGKCAAQKLKNFCSSSLWTCLHHMVILRSQSKITDFFYDFRPGHVPLN